MIQAWTKIPHYAGCSGFVAGSRADMHPPTIVEEVMMVHTAATCGAHLENLYLSQATRTPTRELPGQGLARYLEAA